MDTSSTSFDTEPTRQTYCSALIKRWLGEPWKVNAAKGPLVTSVPHICMRDETGARSERTSTTKHPPIQAFWLGPGPRTCQHGTHVARQSSSRLQGQHRPAPLCRYAIAIMLNSAASM
ncbi:hypothetical protein FPOAC2_12388 [Fusarium poae]|uniref:Uncharacterized protein n=1 Tax=Fusarium poae TaxID=36050 RepID=A0A1B8AG75_FUSPO|nr:hypothetical protein FPOA_11188 [Fusarium poae]